jgi:hypothetical protein
MDDTLAQLADTADSVARLDEQHREATQVVEALDKRRAALTAIIERQNMCAWVDGMNATEFATSAARSFARSRESNSAESHKRGMTHDA